MKRFIIETKWAIIFVVASLLWMMMEKLVGLHGPYISKQYIYTNFFAIVAVAVYVFALIDKRKNFFENKMTWLQGFISGMIISLIVAILSPLSQVITLEIITPEYFQNVITYSIQEGKMTQEEAEAYFNLESYIVQSLIAAIAMGVLTSAIVALFVRKK